MWCIYSGPPTSVEFISTAAAPKCTRVNYKQGSICALTILKGTVFSSVDQGHKQSY